jgi:hypothetical protein
MGEQVILVCDVCGRPAAESATIRVGKRNFVKDFCSTHLSELTAGARAPRRGRRRGTAVKTAARRGRRPPKSGATPKRRGRPPKSAAAPKRRGRPPKNPAS